MWQHYIYIHTKADTQEPFYVGKGKLRRGRFERAYCFSRRSRFWNAVVQRHGVNVHIVASCEDDETAQNIEKMYISDIGRRNLGYGPLVNLTDGGDGHAGIVASQKLRATRSVNAKSPRSGAWVKSIRSARKNGGNGGVVKKGDKLPEVWKENISKAVRGEKNVMYGRTGSSHPTAKKVLDAATGEDFPTVTAAAKHLGMRMQTLHSMLTGHRSNSTTMRLA